MSTRLVERRQRGADITKLPHSQQMFCLHLAADENFEPERAAKNAGFKNPKYAYTLLKKPAIKAFIGKIKREREERTEIASDQIWEYLHRVIYFNPVKWFRPAREGSGHLFEISAEDFANLPEEVGQLIEGSQLTAEYDTEGNITEQYYTVKTVSKAKALEVAAKHALPPPPQKLEMEGMGDVVIQVVNQDRSNEPNEIDLEIKGANE